MMQFLLVLAILAMVAMPATAFRAAPRFVARLSATQQTQFISKNTMLFSEEPDTPPVDTPPPAEKNLKQKFDGALFNKGTFNYSSSFFLLVS